MMHSAFSRKYSSVGAYLDDLPALHFLPSGWVIRIWRRCDLPLSLRRYMRDHLSHGEWRAYTDGVRLFLAIARMAPQDSDVSTALKIRFIDYDASVHRIETWECDCESERLSAEAEERRTFRAGVSRA